MKAYAKKSWATAAALSLALCGGVAACGDDGGGGDTPDAATGTPDANPNTPDAPPGSQTIVVQDDIAANTTWTANNTYVLKRLRQIFVKGGVTLTIEPGTKIQGEEGAALIITRGSKIQAVGTAEKPIVFTSAQPDNAKTRGFWGGLIVLGAAKINNNVKATPPSLEATFEAFSGAIPEGKFGGDKDDDNSGTIKYVRLEFGGFSFLEGREFNNLTLCGVGSGTTIDFVQSHAGSDDGVELFGGTVNVKHLVLTQNEDDGLDTDNGWSGKGQFIVIQHGTPKGSDPSNGYESDNHAEPNTNDEFNSLPRTAPTIYNVTVIGKPDYASPGRTFAAVFRRGTSGHYFNHIFLNFKNGIEIRDAATAALLTGDNPALSLKSSILFNTATAGDGAGGTIWPAPQASGDIVESSFFTATNHFVDPGLPAEASSLTAPNFKPNAGAEALKPENAAPMPAGDAFFTAAAFVGAVGTEDWTAGWTAYPQASR